MIEEQTFAQAVAEKPESVRTGIVVSVGIGDIDVLPVGGNAVWHSVPCSGAVEAGMRVRLQKVGGRWEAVAGPAPEQSGSGAVSRQILSGEGSGPHAETHYAGGTDQVNISMLAGSIASAQHGVQPGGSLHSLASPSSHGFMSSSDKSKLDSLPSSAVPSSRAVNAGAGLTGGGVLSSDITLNVGQGDGISVGADAISVNSTVVRTTRQINTSAPLTGGGDLSQDRTIGLNQAGITHGNLSGLGEDDHLQYVRLAGRPSGQTILGGTMSGQNLTLGSTSHGMKGAVVIRGGDSLIGHSAANDFIPGQRGWKIDQDAAGEMESLTIRSGLSSKVFIIGETQAVNGVLRVSPATALSDVIDSTGPVGGNVALPVRKNVFSQNDVVIVTNQFFGPAWFLITGPATGADGNYLYPSVLLWGANRSYGAGDVVIRDGSTTGKGYIEMNTVAASSPYLDVVERTGGGYKDVALRVRLGNLAGVSDPDLGTLSGYGLFASNANLKGSVFATGRVRAGSGNSTVILDPNDATYRLWVGHETASSAPFRVEKDGSVIATDGVIGGWQIDQNSIRSADSGARIALDNRQYGGLISYGPEDTFDPSTGEGTYQIRIDKATGRLLAANGKIWIDWRGFVINSPDGPALYFGDPSNSPSYISVENVAYPASAVGTFLVRHSSSARIAFIAGIGGSYADLQILRNANGLRMLTTNCNIQSYSSGPMPPISVDSTILCTNLNADLLDGLHVATSGADAHVLATNSGGGITVSQNATVGGTLAVTGASTFSSGVTINGNVTLQGNYRSISNVFSFQSPYDAFVFKSTTSGSATYIAASPAAGGTESAVTLYSSDTADARYVRLVSTQGYSFIDVNVQGSVSHSRFSIVNGEAERLTVAPDGKIGFCVNSPVGNIHGRGSHSGFIHWECDALGSVPFVIVPDGPGDVLYSARLMYVARDSSGGIANGNIAVHNGSETTVTTSTGNTIAFRVNGNGSMDVRRTAGSLTYRISLWAVWL